jgi:hypothetical protein
MCVIAPRPLRGVLLCEAFGILDISARRDQAEVDANINRARLEATGTRGG